MSNEDTQWPGVSEGNEPAFPSVFGYTTNCKGEKEPIVGTGMTLRDYFAGHALQGILSNEGLTHTGQTAAKKTGAQFEQILAFMAYHAADAMLKTREKK